MSDKAPSPGSREAKQQGCTCPILDNAYGRGYLGGVQNEYGETVYVIFDNCPLHRGMYDKVVERSEAKP